MSHIIGLVCGMSLVVLGIPFGLYAFLTRSRRLRFPAELSIAS